MTAEIPRERSCSPIHNPGRLFAGALLAILVMPLVPLTGPAASAATRAPQACTWTVVPSPSPGTLRNTLFGAAGAPGGQAWAVGDRASSQSARFLAPIVEHWNGSAWNVRVMPGNQSNLLGVYAPSSASAWAVGFFIIELDHTLPVIDHFTGTRWITVRSPRIDYGVLSSIAGTSGTNIWAVGRKLARHTVTIAEHYDGRAWIRVPSPSPTTDYLDFDAITVASRHDIWAAGDYVNAQGTFRTLIEHYDGHAWAIVPSPNAGPGDNYLTGMTAIGPRDVWAVGRAFDGSRFRPLALNWNGRAWKARMLPAAGAGDNALNGVTAGPDHSLWAVGAATGRDGAQRTLTEHYRHGHWVIVTSPNANNANNVLYAATVTGGSQIWAVGGWFSPAQGKTVIMRRCQR